MAPNTGDGSGEDAISAELDTILTSFDTSYTWNYGNLKEGLRELYEKSKLEQWNGATQLRWETDVDPESGIIPAAYNPLQDYGPFKQLDARGQAHFQHAQISWQLSQFLHGEQGALITASQIVGAVPWIDAKYYAATQTMDEARHVAFGVLSLRGYYDDMTGSELRDREEFIIDACRLMRDRLVGEEIAYEMGFDPDEVREIILASPVMQQFRQLLFARIVPNVKKLGLLTPTVRRAFEEMAILQFEDSDSEAQDAALGLA